MMVAITTSSRPWAGGNTHAQGLTPHPEHCPCTAAAAEEGNHHHPQRHSCAALEEEVDNIINLCMPSAPQPPRALPLLEWGVRVLACLDTQAMTATILCLVGPTRSPSLKIGLMRAAFHDASMCLSQAASIGMKRWTCSSWPVALAAIITRCSIHRQTRQSSPRQLCPTFKVR